MVRLLSQHSWAAWPSLLEEMSGENGSVMKSLYFMFTLDSLHSRHIGVFRLIMSCLTLYLSCNDMYSHLLTPAEKLIKQSSLYLSLLRA